MRRFIQILLALFWTHPAGCPESYSNLSLSITDATTAVENKNQDKAKALIAEFRLIFESKTTMIPKQGKKL